LPWLIDGPQSPGVPSGVDALGEVSTQHVLERLQESPQPDMLGKRLVGNSRKIDQRVAK
jgi:hypothetical protein